MFYFISLAYLLLSSSFHFLNYFLSFPYHSFHFFPILLISSYSFFPIPPHFCPCLLFLYILFLSPQFPPIPSIPSHSSPFRLIPPQSILFLLITTCSFIFLPILPTFFILSSVVILLPAVFGLVVLCTHCTVYNVYRIWPLSRDSKSHTKQ